MNEKKRKLEQLGSGEQQTVVDLRQTIFFRWASPATTAEGKLDWDDDLAFLLVEFGYPVLDEAIRWHRMNTDRRPSIPAIKARCAEIREKQGRKLSDSERAFRDHEIAVREHISNPNDDEFLPLELIMRDTLAFIALKAECKVKGYSPAQTEMDAWKRQRDADTRAEWRQMRLEGVKGLRFTNERRGGEMKHAGAR